MDLRDALLAALPFLVAIVLAMGFLLVFRERSAMREAARRRANLAEPDLATPLRNSPPPTPPWWGNPWLWVAVSALFLILGLFVWPALFGGIFLFLPFVWVSRGRSSEVDPRTNGHASRHDPSSLGG
jgi:hypothetical protein